MDHRIATLDERSGVFFHTQFAKLPIRVLGHGLQAGAIARFAVPNLKLMTFTGKLLKNVSPDESGPAGDCDSHVLWLVFVE
jgi:hypothetical protein